MRPGSACFSNVFARLSLQIKSEATALGLDRHRSHLDSTLGRGCGRGCSRSWLAGWPAGRSHLLAAWLTGWPLGLCWTARLRDPIFVFFSGVGSFVFPGYGHFCKVFAGIRSKLCLEQPLWGSTPEPLRVHSRTKIWACLLRVLAGLLAGRPAGQSCLLRG